MYIYIYQTYIYIYTYIYLCIKNIFMLIRTHTHIFIYIYMYKYIYSFVIRANIWFISILSPKPLPSSRSPRQVSMKPHTYFHYTYLRYVGNLWIDYSGKKILDIYLALSGYLVNLPKHLCECQFHKHGIFFPQTTVPQRFTKYHQQCQTYIYIYPEMNDTIWYIHLAKNYGFIDHLNETRILKLK